MIEIFPLDYEMFQAMLHLSNPLLRINHLSSAYIYQLLYQSVQTGVVKEIQVFEQELGLSIMRADGVLVPSQAEESTRHDQDWIQFLERKAHEIAPQLEDNSSKMTLIWLTVPPITMDQPNVQSCIASICRRIQRYQYPLKLMINMRNTLPSYLQEWTTILDLSIPKRTQQGLSYISQLLEHSPYFFKDQDQNEKKRISERVLTRIQGVNTVEMNDYLNTIFSHQRIAQSVTSSPKNVTEWEENLLHHLYQIQCKKRIKPNGLILQSLEGFTPNHLAGMTQFKRYLERTRAIIQCRDEAKGQRIAYPKGVLIAGVPGCGKSLAAKLTACMLELPLFRLEISTLVELSLGDPKVNLSQALRTALSTALSAAEAAAPCVLWIDEIDQMLSAVGKHEWHIDSKRLKYLFDWMHTQNQGVYLFASVHQIDDVPSKIIHRGCFDELWKVLLPTSEERKAILVQKLKERDVLWGYTEVNYACQITEGYTGADLDALIKDSQILDFCRDQKGISFEQFKYMHQIFTPLSTQFKAQIDKELHSLEVLGFRDVNTTSKKIPPSLSPTRISFSSYELLRLLDLKQDLVFDFGTESDPISLTIHMKGLSTLRLCWGRNLNDYKGEVLGFTLALGTQGELRPEQANLPIDYIFSKRGQLALVLNGQIYFEVNRLGLNRRSDFYFIKGTSYTMIYCPAGEFWMGSKAEEGDGDEHPRHKVKISKPFLIGQVQVTQALWKAVMGSNPSYFHGDQLPVDKVSWFDCVRFCNKLSILEGLTPAYSMNSYDEPHNDANHEDCYQSGEESNVEWHRGVNGYRLPTEAEWEYSAKAGTELTYAGSNNIDEVAWYQVTSKYEGTSPVVQKKANHWGLYDCSGNVFEWCNDEWRGDAYKTQRGMFENPSIYRNMVEARSVRGGDWSYDADGCRVAYRGYYDPGVRVNRLGFRFLKPTDT